MAVAKGKRKRQPTKKAQQNAPASPPDQPTRRVRSSSAPPRQSAPPSPQLNPPTVTNVFSAQLDALRQELEQARAQEALIRDREECIRLQNEVNEIRGRQQSLPTMPQAPTWPPYIQPPGPQSFLTPPLQPSPMPRPILPTNFALPQQGPQTPAETEAPRRSFLHQGNDPVLAPLLHRFQAVDIKYIKQIYHETFEVKNLNKLSNSFINRLAGGDDETKGLKDLLRCFEVYGQIICFFAHETVALPLQEALSEYRCYISDLCTTYTFNSVRHFHEVFVYSRMQLCQDDAHAWRSPNKHLENQVLRTRPPATQSGAFTPYNSRPNTAPQQAYRGVTPYPPQAGGRNQQTLYCNRFNRNEPCHERSCRYLHTCNLCGQSHPATACNVNVNGGNTGTSANAIPLPSRPPPRP